MGCHFLLQCTKVKSESEVTQSCPTLHNPMDCSLPGSSVHGIFQARVLEWGAIAFPTVECYYLLNLNCKYTHEHLWWWWRLCHSVVSNTCDPMDCSPSDFPGKNTGVGYHFSLQGIFPTQGSNSFLHLQEDFFTAEPPGKINMFYLQLFFFE